MSTSSEDKAAEAKPAAPAIHLDQIVGIVLDTATVPRYHNELHVLDAWFPGLQFLYSQVRLMEQYATKAWDEMSGVRGSVPTPPAEMVVGIGGLACCYQWYAVTLCNFVELIGAIGWELDKSRKPPREYIKEVIPAVLQYRNKVGAHVGRARRNAR